MKRKLSKLCILFLLLGLGTLYAFLHKSEGVSGNEWILAQKAYVGTLADFAEDLDDVYALYISGGMDKTTFLTEWEKLSSVYEILSLKKAQDDKKHPVAPEGHTKSTKRGAEALEEIQNAFGELLSYSVADGKPVKRTELLYRHMACSKKIQEEIDVFMKAYQEAKGR
ncbi:MAG: hypothetical protein ACLSX0_01250 [Anaerostipes caccae]|jgi:hypothetical protein